MKARKNFIAHLNTSGKQILFAFCFLCFTHYSSAQATSPYSRFGLGTLRTNSFSSSSAMGGLTAPYYSANNINSGNPASYASLLCTTIDAGANLDIRNIQIKDSLFNSVNGSLDHVTICFVPKPDKWAVSIGLVPFSDVNYDFTQTTSTDSALGTYHSVFSGKGSLYQVYVGGAYKIKNSITERNEFSIGFNAAYIFGKINYQKVITFPDTGLLFSSRNISSLNVSGFNYTLGIQNRTLLHGKKDDRSAIYMNLGAYLSGGLKMNAKLSNYWDRFDIDPSTGGSVSVDTIQQVFNQKSKITMPFTMGAGVMFGTEQFWLLGVDFKYGNWSKYSSALSNGPLGDNWRISAGFQIIPRFDNRNNYFSRVQYRFGGYYGKSEIIFKSNNLNEAGGTFGLGFPLKSVAHINLAAEIGTRGGDDKLVPRENYYRVTFGFVLNDYFWFLKRKFD